MQAVEKKTSNIVSSKEMSEGIKQDYKKSKWKTC